MPKQKKVDIHSERGQAMTEFAFVLLPLCLLLFGIIQFGIVWNNYVSVTDAARAGARHAAVSRHGDPQAAGCSTARSSAGHLEPSKLGCTVSVVGRLDRPGAEVTVRVTYPYSINVLGVGVKNGTLVSTTTERME